MVEPLIFTKNGNVLESTMVYSTEWEDCSSHDATFTIEDEQLISAINKTGYMVFKEIYTDKETGEVLKSNAHVYQFRGVPMTAVLEQFN